MTEKCNEHGLVPYSDSDTCSELILSENEIEEETCVGQRGCKKQRKLPKRLQNVKARNTSVLPNPCKNKKCGNSCADKFTETERVEINEHFWGISKLRQKDWLKSCIKKVDIKRRRTNSNTRHCNYNYVINFNKTDFKVCQQFLLKTLHVSQMFLKSVRTENTSSLCLHTETTKKYTPHNKSNEASVSIVKNFIKKLPAVPSHYCRNKSNKLYLPQELRNVKGVYKIYVEHLKTIKKETSKLSLRVFRSIFKNNFHLGFHMPKKDKCTTCESVKSLDSQSKIAYQSTEAYQMHIRNKEKSKETFLADQGKSKEDSSFLCVSFDLQKVLNTPHGNAITLFYSRKFAFYNESFYESGTRNGYCFLWGENHGKRGCNEIATLVYKYLRLVDERKTCSSISFYCDSCAGQNRNRAILATLMYFVSNSNYIKTIKITYLLPGHTMMPVDSIHSTIESFTRNRTIWAPSEWYTLISNARTNPKKYNCVEINYSEFKDWKKFAWVMLPNAMKISFKNLRSALFEKNNPIIGLKYGYFENSEIKNCNVNSISRSRRNAELLANGPAELYTSPLKISSAKYRDLKTLCDNKTIPERFHNEFLNLHHDQSIKDILPETDQEDDSS